MGWLLAIVAMVIGVVVIIAGVRGTQEDLFKAITGRGVHSTTSPAAGTSTTSTSTSLTPAQQDAAVQIVQNVLTGHAATP